MIELIHPEGKVVIEDQGQIRCITVIPLKADAFISRTKIQTHYSVNLITATLEAKGLDFLCYEIAREEDPKSLQDELERNMLPYLPKLDWDGKTVLDFGCGAGSSTLCLSRMFPHANIIGVELEESNLRLAKARAEYYGLKVDFFASPRADSLPANLKEYEIAVLSAVYEHLLPRERRAVLPLVWNRLKPNGILFINQTPYRYWPRESHTTGLLGINYLPDRLAFMFARSYSKKSRRDHTWESFLRYGIRGGTTPEILGILRKHGARAELLSGKGEIKDDLDIWLARGNRSFSRVAYWKLLKLFNAVSRLHVTPAIAIAIRKLPDR